jgi:hypothetical protein
MPDERKDSAKPTRHTDEEQRRRAAGGAEVGVGLGNGSQPDSTGDDGSFDADTHESGRRAGRHHGPGEGAD